MESHNKITDFLQKFENNFNPTNVNESPIPVAVLGYGEISTVLSFNEGPYTNLAFKRLPLFSTRQEASDYARLYIEYNDLLRQVGIVTPRSDAFWVKGHQKKHVAYLSQDRLNSAAIGNKIIHQHSKQESLQLFELVLDQMIKLWHHNHDGLLLGLDAQISNWAVKNYEASSPITENTELLFIDTSTPFIRKQGVEQMNPLLFLQSAPRPMRPILRKFFLQDIMDRYYDFRLVAIDLVANLYKEQRADLIPECIHLVNTLGKDYLSDSKLTLKEIEKYYKEDKFIWQLFLSVRRMDRFLNTKLLGKRYEFTLPGKIKR